MRLLLICNEFHPIGGGGSSVVKYAVRYLAEKGHEVKLITSAWRNLPRRERIEGAEIIRVPTVRRYPDFCAAWELVIFGFSALAYTLWLVPRWRPHLVQAYFALPAGWVARLIKIIYGVPYVVYFGGSDMPGSNPTRYRKIYPWISGLIKWIWRGAEVATVSSQGLLELGRRHDPGFDFRLIPNGVELDRFAPVERPPNPRVKILFIGRLIPRKGFQYVVEALPLLQKLAKVPFEVEVVGRGAMRQQLDERAEKLGVSHLIRYVGIVPYERLHESYQGADIFVLTSASEGMPCVVLEAMGCGLPIVTTDVPGNREIVREGENGFLVPLGNTKVLARALAKLVNDEELRRRFGRVGRRLVQAYDWRNIVDQYDELYREILSRKRT
jgi:glycosyltransferase involved in cell wall biosynthesis